MRLSTRALAILAIWIGASIHPGSFRADEGKTGAFPSRRILVRFNPGVRIEEARQASVVAGGKIIRSYTIVDNLHVMEVPPEADVGSALNRLLADPNVLYAEPDHMRQVLDTIPNDPAWSKLWGMQKIQAPKAWDTTKGSEDVVVAVIDTGVYYPHEDFYSQDGSQSNIWTNELEDAGTTGVDDDGNGYVDDIHGWDSVKWIGDPIDDPVCAHGTHVAGIIGAFGNNGWFEGTKPHNRVVGVNWRVKIMALKTFSFLPAYNDCIGFDSDIIECLQYVQIMHDVYNVPIVATNNSYGGGDYGQAFHDAIETHLQSGILYVAAAGNDDRDNDVHASYPADYFLPNIISTAATNNTDSKSSFSNWGLHTVPVGAPGGDGAGDGRIFSTYVEPGPTATYDWANGTSMAAPHVAGLAGLLKSSLEGWEMDWRALRNRIMTGGDDTLIGKTISNKRINAYGSLVCGGKTIVNRLLPTAGTLLAIPGETVDLAVESIICHETSDPDGLQVLTPDGPVALQDGGAAGDQAAGDGIWSGKWTAPATPGDYTLTFPPADDMIVKVLPNPRYTYRVVEPQYVDITGTKINFEHAQARWDRYAELDTGDFPVHFAGSTFNRIRVTPSGVITLNLGVNGSGAPPIPSPEGDSVIAPFMIVDGLDPKYGPAYYDIVGTSPHRNLVVDWTTGVSSDCPDGGAVQFQVVFSEDSPDIRFNYYDVLFGGACKEYDRGAAASIGIQVGLHSGTQFSYFTPSLTSGMSILWTLDCPITLAPPTLPSAQVNVPYAAVVVAGGGSAPYSYTVNGGSLPPGLSLEESTGILSGTPTSAGPFSFTIVARDSTGCTVSHDYAIDVLPCPTIALSPATLPTGTVGSSYMTAIIASGGAAPYSYTATPGALPQGLALDSTTGVLSGIPSTAGPSLFFVTATDSNGCGGTQPYVVDVNPASCPTITLAPTSLPDADLGSPYSQAVIASGGQEPYTYTIPAGAVPPGLVLSSTGTLAGVPTTPGSFVFALSARDANGCIGSAAYSIAVPTPGSGDAPDLTVTLKRKPRIIGGGKTVKVQARCLNNGAGDAQSFQFKAYLSRDSSVGEGDTLIFDRRIDALAAGADAGVTFKYRSGIQLKRLYVILQVDPDNALAEGDETNNTVIARLR